jgi:hypothetical protein
MSMHPLAITLKQKEKKHLIVSPQDLIKEVDTQLHNYENQKRLPS